jgi:hypothetical protein
MIKDKIVIPLLKAIITGVLFALLGAAFFVGSIPWRVFWLVLVGVCLVSWLAVIIPKPERLPALEPKETTVRLELASDNGRRLQFADLPVGYDTLVIFAQGVINGQSLTEAAWCGNGGIFTRAEFVSLRDALIARKLAAWNNPGCPARGWVLTRSGMAAFQYLAGAPTPDNGREAKIRSLG